MHIFLPRILPRIIRPVNYVDSRLNKKEKKLETFKIFYDLIYITQNYIFIL